MQRLGLNYFTTIELVEISVYLLFIIVVIGTEFRFRISLTKLLLVIYLCITPVAALRVYELDLLWVVLAAVLLSFGDLHRGKLRIPTVLFPFLLGVVWVILSYVANRDTTSADPLAIWRIPKMMSYAALVYLICFNRRSASGVTFEQIARVFLASLFFLAMIGLFNYAVFLSIGSYPIPEGSSVEVLGTMMPRVRSLAEDSNFFGQILIVGFSLLFFERRILSSVWRMLFLGVFGVTLCLTFSITSIALGGLLLAVYLCRKIRLHKKYSGCAVRHRRYRGTVAAAITGLLIALNLLAVHFAPIVIEHGRKIVTSPFWINKLLSFSNRIIYQSQVVEIIKDGRIWFGIGPHQTLLYLRQLVHNSYFQLVLEYGIGGLFFVYVVAYLYTMVPRQRTSMRICLIMLALNAYFLEVFYAPSLWICFLIGFAKNQHATRKLT